MQLVHALRTYTGAACPLNLFTVPTLTGTMHPDSAGVQRLLTVPVVMRKACWVLRFRGIPCHLKVFMTLLAVRVEMKVYPRLWFRLGFGFGARALTGMWSRLRLTVLS